MRTEFKKQSVPGVYLRMLVYMFLALVLRVAALLPLACPLVFEPDTPMWWLWVLTPVLFMFLILPLRFSFAQAVVQKDRHRRFSLCEGFGFSRYWAKLGESILHALSVLKWGLPLAAMLCYAGWYVYDAGLEETMTVLGDLGRGWTDLCAAVSNFFLRAGGNVAQTPSIGNIMEGAGIVLAVLGVGVLIWLWGAVRNSATRYIWARAMRDGKPARTEIRRRLKGRRARQLGVGLLNLLLCVPFAAVACMLLKDTVSDLSNMLLMAMITGSLTLPDVSKVIGPMVLAFVLLYMTMLPVRRWLTASFATYDRRHTLPATDESAAQ